MCGFCTVAYSGAAITLGVSSGGVSNMGQLAAMNKESPVAQVLQLQTISQDMSALKAPQVSDPQWLVEQKASEKAAAAAAGKKVLAPGEKITVTYSVTTKGTVTANLTEFKQQANATLNDARGWARMGVVFTEVASGGQFTLVLSEASQLPSFSPGCGVDYSCNAGRYVIINQDRWLGATDPWNAAGGSLRDYRHMVVNHETGHWLGHGHQACGGAGQAAPVMQQQSISLQGCSFNPWPLKGELWSTRLGIS